MSRKRSAMDARLDDDSGGGELDPRLAARIADYARTAGGQRAAEAATSAAASPRPARSVLIGRRSKNARTDADTDLDLSFDDAPASSPPEPPSAAAGPGPAAPWVDLTEDDESPDQSSAAAPARAAAAAPARAAAAAPARAAPRAHAVELLSSDSDDDVPLAQVGSRAAGQQQQQQQQGRRRREPSWMAPARAEGAARRSPRGDGAPRRRRLTSSGPPGRVRNGASASGGGARSRSQPDLDADARLARQLQQEEEQQAQQLYRQRHQHQWHEQRADLRAELHDLEDEEQHFQQRRGWAAGLAAQIAGVADSLGVTFGDGTGGAWGGGGGGQPRPRGRGGRGAAASLQHRELTEDDYDELSRLDEGSSGASKELINNQIKTKLKNDHEDDCCICMDAMKKNTLVRILPCTHTFHSRCVDKWLKTNNSCPICKRPLDAA
jgi:hypothetical protein